MKFPVLVMMLTLSGCAGAAAGAVANAAINTAVAATASGVRRANGDCFTPCNPGTSCNHGTGLCDPLPCGGRCNFDEKCELTAVGDKCVNTKSLPPITP
jgi:hypothetical protein